MKYIKYMTYIITSCFIMGCSNMFFKSTQGTSSIVGVYVPNENINLQLLSYLSGHQIMIKDKCEIDYEWKTFETNSYFGVISSENYKEGKITVK